MQAYAEPILFAIIAFPVVALVFTLPYMIVQYRRHGSIPFMRVPSDRLPNIFHPSFIARYHDNSYATIKPHLPDFVNNCDEKSKKIVKQLSSYRSKKTPSSPSHQRFT